MWKKVSLSLSWVSSFWICFYRRYNCATHLSDQTEILSFLPFPAFISILFTLSALWLYLYQWIFQLPVLLLSCCMPWQTHLSYILLLYFFILLCASEAPSLACTAVWLWSWFQNSRLTIVIFIFLDHRIEMSSSLLLWRHYTNFTWEVCEMV